VADRHLREDTEYQLAIGKRVSQLLPDERLIDFELICRQARGAFPSDVARAVRQQYPTKRLIDLASTPPTNSRLPEESPTRGEWYFTKKSANEIAALLDGKTLCLGVPSVAECLSARTRNVTLVDSSPWLTSRFKLADVHLLAAPVESFTLDVSFDSAVIDPPWYFPDLLRWLRKASSLVRPGGLITLPLMGELTRPSAASDRARIRSASSAIGRTQIRRARVGYVTPRYEQNALIACGSPNCLAWRVADLLLIKNDTPAPHNSGTPIDNQEWLEFRLGEHIVAVRRSVLDRAAATDGNRILKPVPGVNDFTLDSVSWRDTRRGQADIITSQNTVAGIVDPQRVLASLLASGEPERALSKTSAEKPRLGDVEEIVRTLRLSMA